MEAGEVGDTAIRYLTLPVSDGIHITVYQIPVRVISKIPIQDSISLPAIMPEGDSFMGILESISVILEWPFGSW